MTLPKAVVDEVDRLILAKDRFVAIRTLMDAGLGMKEADAVLGTRIRKLRAERAADFDDEVAQFWDSRT